MLSSVSWFPGIALAGFALLSPAVPLPINATNHDCTCKMSVETSTDTVPPTSPGVFVDGCGQCLGVFTQMAKVTKGICTGAHCNVKGECTGTLQVYITSVLSSCCASIAGGYQPSWGSGWLTPGSCIIKELDQVTAKCGGGAEVKWSLTYRDAQGHQTTQRISSMISCSNCDGPPPP